MGEFIRNRLPDPVSYFEGEGLPLVGRAKWRTTRCEFHGGSDSMRVNTESGGWICMSCGTKGKDVLSHHMQARGLDFVAAARALDVYVDDDKHHRGPTKALPLSYKDALDLLNEDALITWIVALDEAAGKPVSEAHRAARADAVRRIGWLAAETRR
jgi:hypothetical protein